MDYLLISDSNYRPSAININVKSTWFDDCIYYTLRMEGEYLIFKKYRFDRPKGAFKFTKGTNVYHTMLYRDLPIGRFPIDLEESDEDKLLILINH